MRLFVAITLPEEVKNLMYDLQKEINSRYAKIRWVFKKNLHLTLKFLGEVDENLIDEIKERLSKIKFQPFKIELGEIGCFPSLQNPRIIWVGLNPGDKINELQQKVDEEMLSWFPSDLNFQSHLTIGRVKLIKNKKMFSELLEEIKVPKLKFEIDSFALMKSQLYKDGPKYTKISEFKAN